MNKKSLVLGIVGASLLFTSQAFAHTTVKPTSVGIGKFQTFTVSAPTEKTIPTIGVRLVLPEGLNHVSPNVKQGWKVEIKKEIIDGEEKVTEIIWTGGNIPAEMRDEFNFSAQVPSKPTMLNWKAYQTYKDGTVVAWDQDPSTENSADPMENVGPYSKTEVIDDLTNTNSAVSSIEDQNNSTATTAIVLSIIALVFSLTTLKKVKTTPNK